MGCFLKACKFAGKAKAGCSRGLSFVASSWLSCHRFEAMWLFQGHVTVSRPCRLSKCTPNRASLLLSPGWDASDTEVEFK